MFKKSGLNKLISIFVDLENVTHVKRPERDCAVSFAGIHPLCSDQPYPDRMPCFQDNLQLNKAYLELYPRRKMHIF